MTANSIIFTTFIGIVFWNNISNCAPNVRCARSAHHGQEKVDEFSDERMLAVMQIKGVPYIPDYMAPNEEVARRQFPNMIELNEAYKDKHHGAHQFNSNSDNEKTKHWLLEEFTRQEVHKEHPDNGHSKQDKSETDLVDRLQKITETLLRLNFSNPPTFFSHMFPKTAASLGLVLRRNKRELTGIAGAVTNSQYCKQRGSLTADGSYLRMCSTCSATTTLPEDHFPRVINEIVCSNADRGCLSVNGVAHGRCSQKVFHLNMLRRTNNSCDSLRELGQSEFANQWEVYTQPIRVSCECEIDKLSMFSRYISATPPTTPAP